MAGAAGGAAQTAQRVGAAIGTATLARVFYHVLVHNGQRYPTAISDAVLAAAGFMALALLMALTELALSRRPRHGREPALDAPSDQAHYG
jgi:hypothetical protein